MSEPYYGEITIFAGNYAPRGWAYCDGQLLPVDQNDKLYSVIGTIYGGDGSTTFALPDLRGRIPVHMGYGPGLPPAFLGQKGGLEEVALSELQMPVHNHGFQASTLPATEASPADPDGALVTAKAEFNIYSDAMPDEFMAPRALEYRGGPYGHNNLMPFLVVNFIIALDGMVPPRY